MRSLLWFASTLFLLTVDHGRAVTITRFETSEGGFGGRGEAASGYVAIYFSDALLSGWDQVRDRYVDPDDPSSAESVAEIYSNGENLVSIWATFHTAHHGLSLQFNPLGLGPLVLSYEDFFLPYFSFAYSPATGAGSAIWSGNPIVIEEPIPRAVPEGGAGSSLLLLLGCTTLIVAGRLVFRLSTVS